MINYENINEVAAEYKRIFGRNFCLGCDSQVQNAIKQIKNYYEMKPEGKYKIKDIRMTISTSGISKKGENSIIPSHINHVNVTDKIVELLCSINPNYAAHFIPNPLEKEEEVDFSKMKVAELKAECEKLSLPLDEWEDLKKSELVDYLNGKASK